MTRPLAILCALILAAPAAIPTARAEEDCGDLGRNYQLIEREAVSVQTNMALISAADRGCEALARQLLDAGASQPRSAAEISAMLVCTDTASRSMS